MKTKIAILSRPLVGLKANDLAWTTGLVLAAIIAPALLAHTPNNQWITGTIVNAILFVAAWRLGVVNALLVAILPSTVALLRGLLPVPMAMVLPYIILSNIILMATFALTQKNFVLGVVSASLMKFAFLSAIVFLIGSNIATPFIVMLTWPQLFTALAGGVIAFFVISTLEKRETSEAS